MVVPVATVMVVPRGMFTPKAVISVAKEAIDANVKVEPLVVAAEVANREEETLQFDGRVVVVIELKFSVTVTVFEG